MKKLNTFEIEWVHGGCEMEVLAFSTCAVLSFFGGIKDNAIPHHGGGGGLFALSTGIGAGILLGMVDNKWFDRIPELVAIEMTIGTTAYLIGHYYAHYMNEFNK